MRVQERQLLICANVDEEKDSGKLLAGGVTQSKNWLATRHSPPENSFILCVRLLIGSCRIFPFPSGQIHIWWRLAAF